MHIFCGLPLGFAGCYTTRNVGRISRVVSVCLFNDYQEPSHRICSLSLFGFLYPRLLEDAVKCAWGQVIARMPGNCDSALLLRVLILSVASSLVYPVPAVLSIIFITSLIFIVPQLRLPTLSHTFIRLHICGLTKNSAARPRHG